jgi:surface carbohydrate biosynthesis protein (TIGR04326 family)
LWGGYVSPEHSDVYSALELAEKNPAEIKEKYLQLIYDLGETEVEGKRVIDHLEISSNFSYWWMTLLTEKCNFAKSPQIDDLIKVIAVRDWLGTRNYKKIILKTSNLALAKSIQGLCDSLNMQCEWRREVVSSVERNILKRAYKKSPLMVQAFIWLGRHLASRWCLRGVGIDDWEKSRGKVAFVSYLFNLIPDRQDNGRFKSRYWTTLPAFLQEHQIKTSWLHIYVENDLLPSAATAKVAINSFNKSHADIQAHVTLHSFLSFKLIISVIRRWYRLFQLSGNLWASLEKTGEIYWPFLERDYWMSMVGPVAMNSLLYFGLFEVAMCRLPKQEKCVYLQENQGWEFGFIHAWKAAGHGSGLIGCPHSTVRFWDLRYFYSKKSYERMGKLGIPLPDYVGVNGVSARNMYIEGGYPKERLAEVEALRYLHLKDLRTQDKKLVNGIRRDRQVLVVGDYLKENTEKQLELLSEAMRYVDDKIEFVVKPHPACPIIDAEYPELDMVITNDAISVLIQQYSLVYASNTTSAAVDAYCAGKVVITALNPKGLNMSPLKGEKEVYFVGNPKELALLLSDFDAFHKAENYVRDYFYLDQQLPRWKELLVDSDKTDMNFLGGGGK